MSSKWPLVKLGEHIDSSLGKMLDKNKNKGVLQPYLGNSNVRWGAFEIDDLAQMKFEEHEAERYGITEGDLIVCEGGEPGRCAIWLDERPNIKIQKALHRVRTKKTLHNYYLYYWFLFAGYKGTLEPYFTGTTIKHLTGKALKNLDIRLPPIAYQKWAVAKLKCLDDKIRANKSINQTLEKIAQAIFKSWFVDFEPTKAKIAAREALLTENPDATPEQIATAEQQAAIQAIACAGDIIPTEQLQTIADLFPNQLMDSELGEIPEGWKLGVLSDLFEFNPKRTLKKGTKAPYLDMKNVPVSGHLAEDVVLKEMKSGTKFINGDTLLARITPCLENGKTAYVDFLDDGQIGWGSTEFIVMRPKRNIHTSIAYLIARQETFRSIAIQTMTGTSGRQRADAKALATKKWVIYPNTLLAKFSQISSSFMALGKINGDQNKSISLMRDTLLPKLLSGEITYTKNGGSYE